MVKIFILSWLACVTMVQAKESLNQRIKKSHDKIITIRQIIKDNNLKKTNFYAECSFSCSTACSSCSSCGND